MSTTSSRSGSTAGNASAEALVEAGRSGRNPPRTVLVRRHPDPALGAIVALGARPGRTPAPLPRLAGSSGRQPDGTRRRATRASADLCFPVDDRASADTELANGFVATGNTPELVISRAWTFEYRNGESTRAGISTGGSRRSGAPSSALRRAKAGVGVVVPDGLVACEASLARRIAEDKRVLLSNVSSVLPACATVLLVERLTVWTFLHRRVLRYQRASTGLGRERRALVVVLSGSGRRLAFEGRVRLAIICGVDATALSVFGRGVMRACGASGGLRPPRHQMLVAGLGEQRGG